MSGERERLCAHVKAAKDWLGRAESSLEKEEDVKGGLNLMLAEAELQRARETRRKWRPARFLAPALAVLLALGGFALQRSAEQTAVPVKKNPAGIAAQDALVHEEKGETALAVRSEPAARLPEFHEAAQPAASQHLEERAEAEQNAALAAPYPLPHQPPVLEQEKEVQTAADSLPSEDMQKLMLSAGRVLRE